MTVVVDDHLLRDWMARRDGPLLDAIAGDRIATTNVWYARLCKSAAAAGERGLLGGWRPEERRLLISGLVALPDDVTIAPMRHLAWRMGELIADHRGLSTLGAEAVVATIDFGARLLVSSRDDGPGIRHCCSHLGVRYDALPR